MPEGKTEKNSPTNSASFAHYKKRISLYYWLAKPGIIYGNLLSAVAGYFYGTHAHLYGSKLVGLVMGVALVIGCGCVLNNILDATIDAKMVRTNWRAMVQKSISVPAAITYAAILGVVGFWFLMRYTNRLTVLAGVIGLVSYVAVYGYAKRHTVHSTLVGTISGAMPIVSGYLAATNSLDHKALILFLILVFWQMPHFYAIALRHLKDYKKASLPVMPLVSGEAKTKQHMLFFIVLFIAATLSLNISGGGSVIYTIIMVLLGAKWLQLALTNYRTKATTDWAKKVFLFSLVCLTVFCVVISLNSLLV